MRTTNRSAASRKVALVLAGSGTVLFVVAVAALLRFPLLDTYAVQILTLEKQIVAQPALGPALTLAIGMAFGSYAAGFLALHRRDPARDGKLILIAVIAPPLICALALLFAHPTTSLDLYDYLYRGHMAARYNVNTFVQTPEDLRSLDRLYWYTAWRRATTAYGPLWELLSVGVARLAGPSLFALTLGFKLTSFVGWLLTAGAIAIAARPDVRLLSLFIWLWNPLVLWELVGAGHNDGWMLAWAILAFACLKRWPVLALTLITAGTLFKYPAALLWPIALIAALANTPSRQGRLALALRSGVFSAVLVALAYAPWWAGADMLEQLRDRRELFANTPLALLRTLVHEQIPQDELLDLLNRLSAALLLGGVIGASWLASRRPQAVALIGVGLLLWFLTVCTPWFQPWYLTWPIALFALQPRSRWGFWMLSTMCLGALLTYPAFAALRPWLDWPLKEAPWQTLIVALIYGPPLLVLGLRWRPRPPRTRPIAVVPQHQEVA